MYHLRLQPKRQLPNPSRKRPLVTESKEKRKKKRKKKEGGGTQRQSNNDPI
jgi:hypothetical protein